MFFYLALTIMVIYTLFFFYIDTRDYLNKGGTFGEAMTNMQMSQNQANEQLQKFLDSRPNLKQAIDANSNILLLEHRNIIIINTTVSFL